MAKKVLIISTSLRGGSNSDIVNDLPNCPETDHFRCHEIALYAVIHGFI